MEHISGDRELRRAAAPLYSGERADLAAALENGLIFIILLIAVGAALYILNGQLIRIL